MPDLAAVGRALLLLSLVRFSMRDVTEPSHREGKLKRVRLFHCTWTSSMYKQRLAARVEKNETALDLRDALPPLPS